VSAIPDDIMKAAEECVIHLPEIEGRSRFMLRRLISSAILAERERCAKIAEERFTEQNVLKTTKGKPYSSSQVAIYAATNIAGAIREGMQP
jgi:hypothetical protein